MALPILTGNPKMLANSDGLEASSSEKGKQHISKLMIPSKEKFLPGFKGFDAAVGFPESPTESAPSEFDGFPITPPLKGARADSLTGSQTGALSRSISDLQLNGVVADDSAYVADGFRPGGSSTQTPPSYDAIYGALGQGSSTTSLNAGPNANEAGPLPTKHLHTVPSVSLFRTPSASGPSTPSSPSTPASSTPVGPLLYARFPESQNANPRRISIPNRAPSTPGLTHSNREMIRIQVRSIFAQFFKAFQFACNDTEKCLVYGYSDAASMKVPWNVPLERALRQLWKQVMEYDVSCGKVKPESQGKRELATYHAVAMGLISSDLPSEKLCIIWDRSLAFAIPARRECLQGWLSFTEFIAVVWMVGMASTDPSFV
ncbi:hypothetical protein H072_2190 [Dactylellina haptotyla CBS 200.50]|uniref:Uncharacterized protein n=1 Tax=Dactylellina haptotyla (strain CBS 200.50) TaxID=1284197 RepID=S8C887_DACHA|nr:hypothetical protein H072_2190 [Dactylellina haptotyla CBS 200.50]